MTRELTITPSRNWGGDGILGCVLGFGALHRLPAPLHEPVQAPGETLFDSEQFPPTEPTGLLGRPSTPSYQSHFGPANFMTPAFTAQPPTSKPIGSVGSLPASSLQMMEHAHIRHKPKRVHHSALDMDMYLKEGEEKSKEIDRGSTPTGNKGLPPPPKGIPPPPRKNTLIAAGSPPSTTTPKQPEGQSGLAE